MSAGQIIREIGEYVTCPKIFRMGWEMNRTASAELDKESAEVAFAVSLFATLVSFGISDFVFNLLASNFQQFRQARVEFAFASPTQNPVPFLVILVTSGIAVRERQWIAPFCISAILSYGSFGGFAYSGPGELLKAVEPLITFRWELVGFALIFNFTIIIFWILDSKRRALATWARSQADM